MLHLAIVDDHAIVRAGFREMLATETDLHIVFEAATGEDALARVADTGCDLLLLDLSLPGQSGVDVLRTLRRRGDSTRVLVLTGFPEDRYAVAMIRLGADGYLCKNCERDELVQAIRTIAQGRRYLSARTAELLAGEIAGDGSGAAHEQLSERELQVFLRLAHGESVSAIADALHLSIKTVSTYRSRVLEKLDVTSNAELATYAIRHGLIVA
ncbi:response regulator transcription factor [Azoarcus olearius]|uniref:DNA-binding response regulator n=1 Tax=Azoarcus sp. (strain BH72) TaxID=418699 RepID=A1K2Y1_AZOSB|nr:response regulator transcription factor [Azoarcus olearius]ANQ83655.1 DNA-binding response regulator [Azoarcus olearius]CAL93186.1 DNA-binding response regulator [Azoarcus olearius]